MTINILEYLENSAEKYPEKCAFADYDKEISYSELVRQAKQIGTYIYESGNGEWKNIPIAVLIDRNIESLILFMGIAYSGNFYVPIDYTMPQDRIQLILDTLQPSMVLSSVEGVAWDKREVIYYKDILLHNSKEQLLNDIRNRSLDTDPLYAIFTSGSTGIPKGVLVSHRSVIDLVEQFCSTFDFPEQLIIGNQAPMDFDVSIKDIYNSLKLGGTVEVIPKQFFSFPLKLIAYLNDRRINVIIWAVSALRIVANFNTLDKLQPEFLECIMFSGEVMPVKVLNYWKKAVPEAQYVNLYGPTEITCNCSYYIVNREFSNEETLPIGQAFRNSHVFLLDSDNGLITGENEIGEICVKGSCLALGYYNNKEKTDEVFIQNPLQSYYEEKIYKTGDLGTYHKGEIYYSARKDYQIKHMGHRIELGEIETVINAMDFIEAACCIYDEVREKIILCYQADSNCDKIIIKSLTKKLSKFMWPNKYVFYNRLPINKNGKIDRVQLKKENSMSGEQRNG